MSGTRTPNASRVLRDPQSTRPVPTEKSGNTNERARNSTAMTNSIQLIHEALSRARMRRPQESTSEAYRSARQITIRARRETNRWLAG